MFALLSCAREDRRSIPCKMPITFVCQPFKVDFKGAYWKTVNEVVRGIADGTLAKLVRDSCRRTVEISLRHCWVVFALAFQEAIDISTVFAQQLGCFVLWMALKEKEKTLPLLCKGVDARDSGPGENPIAAEDKSAPASRCTWNGEFAAARTWPGSSDGQQTSGNRRGRRVFL
jgi:hypothetical protein